MARYESSSCQWSDNWNPGEQICTEGLGIDAQGSVQEVRLFASHVFETHVPQLRFHTVTAKDRVERYIAVVMDVQKVGMARNHHLTT